MISDWLANAILLLSLATVVGAYVFVSRREGSYLNIMTPYLVVNVPAFYLLPLIYNEVFGVEATPYSFAYVYITLAAENVIFAYVYTRPRIHTIRLPFHYGHHNFGKLAVITLGCSALLFAPLLVEFREYILDPRRIYELTRTGFGTSYYISSTCAYIAVICILFSNQSFSRKTFVVVVSALVLSLHGSKGQLLSVLFFLVLFVTYVKARKLKLFHALLVGLALVVLLTAMFAATMTLGNPMEAAESLSEYSDYTRNAMMLIDSNFPVQYGRLTLESNVLSLIPRSLMPNKPKDFGAFYLDAEFFPDSLDEDKGSPSFGIGVQYADFGFLAIVYLGLFAALRGWLARVFVNRVRQTLHPADFLMLAFFADISVFPIGTGWLLPETLALAFLLRFVSCLGANKIYHETTRRQNRQISASPLKSIRRIEGV